MRKLKNILPMLGLLVMVISGCSKENENITFVATIESIYTNGIMVRTQDDVGFDAASVEFAKEMQLPFTLEVGQVVEIEALPEIRETYPVQITGVNIILKEQKQKVAYKKISPERAKELMEEDVVILDVRTQTEFEEGHIPEAVLLTDAEIEEKAADVLPDKEQTILVYCRSGRRSAIAAKTLIGLGYTDVYDFGGIIDWTGEIEK